LIQNKSGARHTKNVTRGRGRWIGGQSGLLVLKVTVIYYKYKTQKKPVHTEEMEYCVSVFPFTPRSKKRRNMPFYLIQLYRLIMISATRGSTKIDRSISYLAL